MKKLLILFLLLLPTLSYGQTINIDNEPHNIDTKIIDNTSFIQLRDIANILDLNTQWNSSDKSVSISNEINEIVLYINRDKMLTEKGLIDVNNAPVIVDGKTYLPLRIIAEQFKYKVGYKNGVVELDYNKYTASISKKEYDSNVKRLLDIYDNVYKNFKIMTNEELKETDTTLNELTYLLKDSYVCGYGNECGSRVVGAIGKIRSFLDVCQDLTDAQEVSFAESADFMMQKFLDVYNQEVSKSY